MTMGWQRAGGNRFFAPAPASGGWPKVGPDPVTVERVGVWSFAEVRSNVSLVRPATTPFYYPAASQPHH